MVFRYGEYFIKFGVADGTNVNGQNPSILRELHIGERVADHNGVTEVNIGEVIFCLQRHSYLGFAAGAVLRCQVRAAINGIHRGVLREQAHLHVAVHRIHLGLRADFLADALLVGHQDNVLEQRAQHFHGIQKMVHKHKLFHRLHITAHNLHIHDAVPVKKKGIHHCKKTVANIQFLYFCRLL